jgi:RNase H-fold protein (predicted Holliday junction resolvase)
MQKKESYQKLSDEFNINIIQNLLPIFDLQGDTTLYFLEALAVIEKKNMLEKLDFGSSLLPANKGTSSIKIKSVFKLDILSFIQEIIRNINDKSLLVGLVAHRMNLEISENTVMENNKDMMNGLIIKELNAYQFSKIVRFTFSMKIQETKSPNLTKKFIENLKNDFENILPIEDKVKMSFIDTRLRTSAVRQDLKKYIEKCILQKSKLKEGSSMEDFSEVCLSVLRNKNEIESLEGIDII